MEIDLLILQENSNLCSNLRELAVPTVILTLARAAGGLVQQLMTPDPAHRADLADKARVSNHWSLLTKPYASYKVAVLCITTDVFAFQRIVVRVEIMLFF